MDVGRLRKDELEYELLCRNVTLTTGQTVDHMRVYLRQLIKLEKLDPSLQRSTYKPKIAEELSIVETKIQELTQFLDTVKSDDGKLDSSKCLSLQSRLAHLYTRMNRISSTGLSNEHTTKRSSLLGNIFALIDSFEQLTKSDNLNCSILFDALDTIQSSSREDLTSLHEPVVQTDYKRIESVRKWNFKFTGEPNSITVHNFLERVEELCKARGVSHRLLFDSAIDLFDGKALVWYRSNKSRFSTWAELSDLLARHYQPPDYRSRLFRDIMDRTQGPNESIVDFMACITSMCERYGGLTSEAELDIILRNLSPFYTMQLPVITSLQQLEVECLALEVKKFRADSYKPPPKSRQNLVEPNFACMYSEHEPSVSTSVCATVMQNNTFKCWNCENTGHLFRDCSFPKRIRCFKCQHPGVTIRSCPKCSTQSGNAGGKQ